MNHGLTTNDPTVVSAFQAALLHQGLIVLGILALVGISWNLIRTMQLRRAAAGGRPEAPFQPLGPPEPAARRLLRVSFGLLWVFDGLLQAQSSMPLGLVPQVIHPAGSSSPGWVQHLVNWGASIWNFHPVPAAAAAVWIQIGIGAWMLAAPRGNWSRSAGAAGVAWGLVVWVFGEAFGAIFAPGLTWLFGAPGAVLLYCAAGVLVALPERYWVGPRLGKIILRVMGVFFLGMALLQAWPGRGFWQGQSRSSATPGSLTGMVQQMSQTPQPHLLSSLVARFGDFDAAHGWAVNLFVVIVLAATGVTFIAARPRITRIGVIAAIVLCLADWVFIEDLGFLGGSGTDPNSMIPIALVFTAGYLAIARPSSIDGAAVVSISDCPSIRAGWREWLIKNPTYAFRCVAGLGAVGVVLLGVVPMAAAAANRNADPILDQATNGTPAAANTPAPAFALVDQNDRAVSLGSLRGKAIALTFLDPVCTSDCPIIAQEFRIADDMLGSTGRQVEFLAVDANPRDVEPAFLRAFDAQEGLDHLPNWLYLTGSLQQLQTVWNEYGLQVASEPGGAMIAHSDIAYVIDAKSRTRFVLEADPGPATSASKSSFAVTLAGAVEAVVKRP